MSYVCDRVEVSQKSASGVVKDKRGEFYGLVVTASSSALVTIYDNVAASGTILYTKTLSAGEVVHFGGVGMAAGNGIYFQLVSGTGTVNVLYR